MIEEIKDINTFVVYCKNQIDLEDSTETEIEKILTNLLVSQATVNELLENANYVIETYYKFLKIAIKKEHYEKCAVMHKALSVEIKHFKKIADKCDFKKNVIEDIDSINEYHKKNYIDAN